MVLKGIPSGRRISESTLLRQTKLLLQRVSTFKRIRRFSENSGKLFGQIQGIQFDTEHDRAKVPPYNRK